MASANVKITKSVTPPVAAGVHYRLVCMTGKNKGLSYYLTSVRAVMGRSDNADVQVLDTKSSREHAELAKVGDQYVLTDLGSQNGVVVNDLKVTQHHLTDGDLIIIGQTVYKYNVIEVKPSLELVENDDDEEWDEEEEEEVALLEDKKSKKKKGKKKQEEDEKAAKKKRMLVGLLILLGAVFLLDDGSKKTDAKKTGGDEAETDLAGDQDFIGRTNKAEALDRETKEKLLAIIHRGRREYREGNYFRAIDEFELALILVPGHAHASYLLDRAKQRLDDEIRLNKSKAERDAGSLQYDAARVSLCSILRILSEKKDDPRYKDAEQSLAELEEKMGLEKGEIKCE